MIILAIETSCDETAIAVIEADEPRTRTRFARSVRGRRGKTRKFKILSNVVSSQAELHKKYGGVWPTLAKREHQRNLVPVLSQSLKQAKLLKNKKSKIKNKKHILKIKKLNDILTREKGLLKNFVLFLKKYQKPKVDLIAVTVGPGLEPCLWVGINFTKALSFVWDLPIIPVNHIEAHILANFIGKNPKSKAPGRRQADSPEGCMSNQIQNPKSKNLFPAISLIVSGGHTQLILMKDFGKYKIIGETKDDAAGECFDKTARILGLGYPGGPAIAAEAAKLTTEGCHPDPKRSEGEGSQLGNETLRLTAQGDRFAVKLPRPMISQKNYDFSFSGLKTAVLYDFKKQPKKVQKSKKYIQEMAKEIQQAIIDVLIKKTIKAGKDFKAKAVILGGGVAANKELRQQFQEKIKKELPNTKYLIPNIQLATDNAAMVGATGYYGWLRGKTEKWENIKAEANLRIGK